MKIIKLDRERSPSLFSRQIDAYFSSRKLIFIGKLEGGGLGDALVMTAYMRLLHDTYGFRFIVVTKHPVLFIGNPLVVRNIDLSSLGFMLKPMAKWLLRKVHARHIIHFAYRPYEQVTSEQRFQDHILPISLVEICSLHTPFKLDYSRISNEIHFLDSELAQYSAKFTMPENYIIINPHAKTTWTANKAWAFDRFQEVVRLTPEFTWVQLGAAGDTLLSGVVDMRGKTSLREVFYLLSRARAVLATEGLHNHAASAFNIPSFVIYSGLGRTELTSYQKTIPIVRQPQVACAPCWITTPCPVAGRPCMGDISAKQVVATMRQYFETNSGSHS